MNCIIRLVCLVMIVTAVSTVQAQSVDVTEKEFTDVFTAATAKLSGRAIRITEIRKKSIRSRNVWGERITWIIEMAPPDRKREIYSFQSSYGGLQTERIWIGSQAWERDKSKKWFRNDGIGEFGPQSRTPESFIRCKKSQKVTAGETFTLYELTTNSYGHQVVNVGDKNNIPYVTTAKILISKEGLLHQFESKRISAGEPQSFYTSIDYEYDPKDLKIEAPVKIAVPK